MQDEVDIGGYPIPRLEELPPADLRDPVVEAYRRDIDLSLIRENLRLTAGERIRKLEEFVQFLTDLRQGRRIAPLRRAAESDG